MLLKIEDLHTYYGNIHALHGVNIEVQKGEIVTLLGSNGAGKTTTLCSITGLVPAQSGRIIYEGGDIAKTPAHRIPGLGISLSPEGREVFADLNVKENLRLGNYHEKNQHVIDEKCDMVFDMFPRLKERLGQLAGTLSGGEQQMLAIGRALMSSPRLLLLDEPSLGLAPNIVEMIFEVIVNVNKQQGITILLVEQNANIALQIADRGYVLETGRVGVEGTGKDLLKNDGVRRAYLGGG